MAAKKHILIVDDVTTNLKVAADVLQDTYKLSMAKSGEQALEFLTKVRPDLILLDVRMPGMDGYETLERIKANPDTASIPVVFLTVDDQRESEIKGLKMGAMDFILKPFEPEVMLSRIDKILQIEDLRKNLSISNRKDSLTSLWNRKYMEEEVSKTMERPNNNGVFVMVDIDRFKSINDTYGHMMGDAILSRFAEIISTKIGPHDVAARMGGDEFALFLKGDYTTAEIAEYCGIINNLVETEVSELLNGKANVTSSIGIAMAPQDGTSFEVLYSRADKALYYVKQNGKNGFHFYRQNDNTIGDKMNSIDSSVDMLRLQNLIKERNDKDGAFRVEYDGFKHIVQFVSRFIGRTGDNVELVLFTLRQNGESKLSTDQLENAMNELERAIVVSLRQGDVTTQYSSFQYVVLLMNTNSENASKVAERICNTWNEVNEDKEILVSYDLSDIEPKD